MDSRTLADEALVSYLEGVLRGRDVRWMAPVVESLLLRLRKVARNVAFIEPGMGQSSADATPAIASEQQGEPRPVDVVVVTDLAAHGLASAAGVAALQSALKPGGVLIAGLAARSASGGYEDLFAWVGASFPSVRMLGQLPFAGLGFVDFERASRAASVTFDGLLAGDESSAVERYFAVGSVGDVALDAYYVGQIPSSASVVASADGESLEIARLEEALAEQSRRAMDQQSELDRRTAIARDLSEELARVRAQGTRDGRVHHEFDALLARVEASTGEVARLEADVARLDGLARGYRARAAELEELHLHAEGQAAMARADIEGTAARNLVLERELGELHKQFELELARAQYHSPAARVELETLRTEADALGGEREGLRLRLRDREAALESAGSLPEQLRKGLETARDDADHLREELSQARGRESELSVRLKDAEARCITADRSAREAGSALAARDALVTRLGADVAELEQACRQASEQKGGLAVELDEVRREIVALRERAAAVADQQRRSAELDAQVGTLRLELVRAKTDRDALRRLLVELRGIATHMGSTLQSTLPLPSTGFTAVGMESPDLDELRVEPGDGETALRTKLSRAAAELEALRGRVGHLARGAEEREQLLQSLTLQVEEREERLRKLESDHASVAAGKAGGPLQREILALQERVARLSDQLLREREARRAAESAVGIPAPTAEPGSDAAQLAELIAERDRELLALRGRLSGGARELDGARDAVAQARAGLEVLLNQSTSRGDPSTAERVGSILRLLSRLS